MSTVVMAVDGATGPHDVLPTYHSMVRKPEHGSWSMFAHPCTQHRRNPLPA